MVITIITTLLMAQEHLPSPRGQGTYSNDLTLSAYIHHLQRILAEHGDMVVVTPSETSHPTRSYFGVLDPPTVVKVDKDEDEENEGYVLVKDREGNMKICIL